MNSIKRFLLVMIALLLFASIPIACAPNSGEDGADGSVGADGEDYLPPEGAGAPQAPSNLEASAANSSQIDLSWTFNSGSEAGFNVQRMAADDDWETIGGTTANVTIYQDKTVECEKTYSYRVLAYNDYGESSPSSESSATADYCELDAPADLTGILDDEQDDGSQRAILLSWSEGAGELPGVPGSYEIYRKTFNGSWSDSPLATQPSDQTTYTDEDAACDGTFQYRVRAANGNGVKSAFSNTATAPSDACPLTDPSNLSATSDLAGTIEISWDINDPDATGYLLQRREHETRDDWATIADLPEGATNYTDISAVCETSEYDYRLRAYNNDKQSAWIETLTPGLSFCPVEAPSGLFCEVLDPEEIRLSWVNNADNQTGFYLYRDESLVATLSFSDRFYRDTDVVCETTYRYKITAFSDNVESDFSNTASVQSDFCPVTAPYNVASIGNGNEVTVSWEHDQQYVESFDVQRRTGGEGIWQLLDTVAAPDTNVTDATVECYKDYEYRVLAYNENVESDWSVPATGAATGCTPIRPQPVLVSSEPDSYLAYSQAQYPLTFQGQGIATDTKALIGDYIIDCDTSGEGADCRADESGDPVAGTCADTCTAALPDELMKHADEYVVRLYTPSPVYQGSGSSENFEYFAVIAPLPEITKIWPRGVFQEIDADGNPIPQELDVGIWADKLMDNVQFRLDSNFGKKVESDEIPGNPDLIVRISTHNLLPRDESYSFTAINPSPGGGERSRPFGVNPLIEDWTDNLSTDLRSTRAAGSGTLIWQRADLPRVELSTGMGWSGNAGWAALRDEDDRLMTRMSRAASFGILPLPVGSALAELQDELGFGPDVQLADRQVLYRGGDGTFGAILNAAVGEGSNYAALGDFNGDGNPDLATSNNLKNNITVLLGNGDGTFSGRTDWEMGKLPEQVVLGDLNGDGILDVATANEQSDDVSVRFGDGNGGFGGKTDLAMGPDPMSVAIGDLNNDGLPDLAAAARNAENDNGYVTIRFGMGGEKFSTRRDYPLGAGTYFVKIGDLNDDGMLDLIAVDKWDDRISILLGIGDGVFGNATELAVGQWPEEVAVGDLNGDGALDLATVNNAAENVSVWLGNGDGSFTGYAEYNIDSGQDNKPSSISIDDLNGDGAPDIVTANYWSHEISVLIGAGDGTFGASVELDMGWSPRYAGIGDLNNDGAPDIFATNGNELIAVRLGNGQGAFHPKTEYPLDLYDDPEKLAVGDLNGDNIPDLAVANHLDDNVSILIGNGDGSFGAKTDYAVGSRPSQIALGYLNGDANLDLAASNWTGDTISIRLGNGGGAFGPETQLPTGAYPSSMAIADINNDGAQDLLASIYAYDVNEMCYVSILLGHGDGTFDPKIDVQMGDAPEYVAVGLINDDAAPDIVTANRWGNDVSVRLGNGDGTFGDLVSYPMGQWPECVAVADLNGDSFLDLATSNRDSDDISIRFGNGDGSFGDKTDIGVGDDPRHLTTGDINGDGTPDIATANEESNDLVILLNDGTGNFSAKTRLLVGKEPLGLALADLDGDSAMDIVVANSSSDDISVRLLGIPGTWRQYLTEFFSDDPDKPWLLKYVPTGFTELDIHQAAQTVTKVGVRILLEWAVEPTGSVDIGLTAPDGQMVDLGSHSDFTPWYGANGQTTWRLNKTFREYDFNGETGVADLANLHGVQPMDYWTLSIDNQTGSTAQVKNFTVVTDGEF